MHDRITQELARVERESGIQILFACESGSRAWGFPSPDSDYDVRFIYTHSVEWHLHLQKQRDTYEVMLPDDLDLSGWELGKALRLFAGCNLALFEWLNSPIVYLAQDPFLLDLRTRMPAFFNPKKALYHYLNMADHGLKHAEKGHIPIKKLFYALRPLLACRWIQMFATMPPTDIQHMLDEDALLSDQLRHSIRDLIERKASLNEQHLEPLSSGFQSWLEHTREGAGAMAQTIVVPPTPGLISLNPLMIRYCLESERF